MLSSTRCLARRARISRGVTLEIQRFQPINIRRAQFLQARENSDKVSNFSDPYPLPLSSATLGVDSLELSESLPSPLERHNETIETLRARLVYQSRKRGTLEADLLLSTFAGENLHFMDEAQLQEFDKLMDEPDWDIYYWAVGKRDPPPRWGRSPLLAKLRKHAANEGKVVRRMPDLSAFPKSKPKD